MRFENKSVIITGGGGKIAKAYATAFAKEGANLCLPDIISADSMVKAIQDMGGTAISMACDVSNEESVKAMVDETVKQFGTVDILINNAGISQRSQAEETALEVDRKIMEVNFFAQVNLTKSLWPLLINSNHANIVLISSVVGTFGFPQRSAYSASKHALEGFFESWMLENKRENIFFTTISPGRIYTNISYSALKADGSTHQQLDEGQAKGISAEACAKKIINGIIKNKRKVYVAQQEMVLIILRKYVPFLFFKLVKKLQLK